MTSSRLDFVVWVSFHACVLVLSLVKSRGRKDAADDGRRHGTGRAQIDAVRLLT